MSWQAAEEPESKTANHCRALQQIIVPRARDLGGFEVRRVLPSLELRSVGPFVFLDQMGPTDFSPGGGIDVRPHPHIGLATVTYLFEGTIIHRDSLGTVQPIEPGEVNWMTAGRGIVHSERSDVERRKERQRLHGVQIWVALPREHEETAPDFAHYPAASLPRIEGEGASARLIAGTLFGKFSPLRTHSPLFYADVVLRAGSVLALPVEYEERALYILEGLLEIAGQSYERARLLVFSAGDEVIVKARLPTRMLLFGGPPLDGPRHVWWNFVSSSRERIESAKKDWREGKFAPVPGDKEFIPLPEK
jgi:redox-sensitive bicupin YhaK (pirin superfamily)